MDSATALALRALHSGARQYCAEHAARWHQEWRQRGGSSASFEQPMVRDAWARYLVLDAIGDQVLSVDPESFPTQTALRDYLLAAGRTAESYLPPPFDDERYANIDRRKQRWPPPDTRMLTGDDATAAMQEERRRYCAYIEHLMDADLRRIEVLPYYRIMSRTEGVRLWRRMRKRWDLPDFPLGHALIDGPGPANALSLKQPAFRKYVPQEILVAVLAQHRVRRILRLGQLERYESDVGQPGIHFYRECFWTADRMTWLIYVSHESSVSFWGDWQIGEIKSVWPDWERYIYTDYMHLEPV